MTVVAQTPPGDDDGRSSRRGAASRIFFCLRLCFPSSFYVQYCAAFFAICGLLASSCFHVLKHLEGHE